MADELSLNDIFGTPTEKENPVKTVKKKTTPTKSKEKENNLTKSNDEKQSPVYEEKQKVTPEFSKEEKELPPDPELKNTITVNGDSIVIKPTKLKYFRVNTIQTGKLLSVIPLGEFFSYDKGVFDPERDSDQMLYDFLIAALDNEEFVKKNYNDFTADDIDKIIKIIDRLNHTEEKEEKARKNREAQGAKS